MKTITGLLGLLLMIVAIPLGLYMWLKWGWYDGFVLAFNAIMNDPKSAGDFAWGIIKILVGGFVGALTGYIAFFGGALITAATVD